jgi:cobalamin biosynthesis protein CobD/CbiB
MQQQTIARTGTCLFYLGGAVWLVYALVKYLLGWDVSLRQFLPYHLAVVIPGVILKRCSARRLTARTINR